jgi:PhnB protein
MQLELFINFDGNCREAVQFYAKVFKSEVGNLMTYGEAPADPNYPVSEADRDRIIYAGIPFGGMVLMFMDVTSDWPLVVGNNISPTISVNDKAEVTRLFNELSEGGEVMMELQTTFFSQWFGMVRDQYGVYWQILHFVPSG